MGNLTREQIGRLISIVLLAVIAILQVFGIAVDMQWFAPEARSVERIGFLSMDDSAFRYGADLTFYSDDQSTQKLKMYGDSGNIDSEGTLDVAGAATFAGTVTVDSVPLSGPVTFGSASSVVSGTTIAHGLATTPTAVVVTPVYAGVLTNTVYVISTDSTSITLGIGYTTGVTTVTTVYWMAGK